MFDSLIAFLLLQSTDDLFPFSLGFHGECEFVNTQDQCYVKFEQPVGRFVNFDMKSGKTELPAAAHVFCSKACRDSA